MASRWFTREDATWERISDATVVVFGYGNQGRSQALNLRDTGLHVTVANREDDYSPIAARDGFDVVTLDQGAEGADVVAVLLPDEVIPEVFARDISRRLSPGALLVFASGFNVAFNLLDVPEDVDVGMVAPRMLGEAVRSTYLDNQGFPSLVAVEQDVTGTALERILSYADGIGSLAIGVLESSCLEEAAIDIFAEHVPLLYELRCQFDVLTEAGLNPEAVLLELYASGELVANARAIQDYGLWGQLKIHSPTSQYGQEVVARRHFDRTESQRVYKEILEHILSGSFAKEWIKEYEEGSRTLESMRHENLASSMVQAEKHLYARLGRRTWDSGELQSLPPSLATSGEVSQEDLGSTDGRLRP